MGGFQKAGGPNERTIGDHEPRIAHLPKGGKERYRKRRPQCPICAKSERLQQVNERTRSNGTPLFRQFAAYESWANETERWYKSLYNHQQSEVVDQVIGYFLYDFNADNTDKRASDVAKRESASKRTLTKWHCHRPNTMNPLVRNGCF